MFNLVIEKAVIMSFINFIVKCPRCGNEFTMSATKFDPDYHSCNSFFYGGQEYKDLHPHCTSCGHDFYMADQVSTLRPR